MQLSKKLKSRANMLAAVSCAQVPKLTVIVGNGFGSSHFLMVRVVVMSDMEKIFLSMIVVNSFILDY